LFFEKRGEKKLGSKIKDAREQGFLRYALKYIVDNRMGEDLEDPTTQIVEYIPESFYPYLSKALFKLCSDPLWISKERIVENFARRVEVFPFGSFIDEKNRVIVTIDIDSMRNRIALTVRGPFKNRNRAFVEELSRCFINTFRRGYFSIHEGLIEEESVEDFPEWDTLSLEPDKKRLIEMEVFKHLGVTSILKGQGFKSSLSILFYGEPGTGKTHTIRAIVKKLTRQNVPVFNLTGLPAESFLGTVRYLDFMPEAVFIYEDVESLGSELSRKPNPWEFSAFLSLLDGLDSKEKRIYIFTTNFYESLDPAVLRPGRMDVKMKFEATPSEVIGSLVPHLSSLPKEVGTAIKSIVREYNLNFAEAHWLMKHIIKRNAIGEGIKDIKEILKFLNRYGRAERKQVGFEK
jgi:hypothetical protein